MTLRSANPARLILSLSLATGLICTCANAPAQTASSVTIPFAFSADNQYVAPGTYKVELMSDRFLSLRNTYTNKTQVLMVRPESGQAVATRGRLVFHLAGSRKYLAQVWIAGTSIHSEVAVQHRRQNEFEKSHTSSSTIELALK